MSSFHLPIVIGQGRSERVVIVHLIDKKEEYEENRVVITSSGSQNTPLFKISKDAHLIGMNREIEDIKGLDVSFKTSKTDDDPYTIISRSEINEKLLVPKNTNTVFCVTEDFSTNENNKKNYINKSLFNPQDPKKYTAPTFVKVCEHKEEGSEEVVYKFCIVDSKDTNTIKPTNRGTFNIYCVRATGFDGVVVFKTFINNTEYRGELHIVRPAADAKIVRINADLGSDATQINYFLSTGESPIQNIDIVRNMLGEYSTDRKYGNLAQPQNGKPLFTQREEGNDHFYKTGNITFKNKGDIDKSITDSDTFINYLNTSAYGKNQNTGKGADTWDKERNFNSKLINIKILYSYSNTTGVTSAVNGIMFKFGNDEGDVTNHDDLRLVLRAIYKQLIKISTKNRQLQDCRLFSVLLLVPNIYVQANIDSLLYELNKLNKNNEGIKYDFRIISESDSAFVGIKEVREEGGRNTILGKLLDSVSNPLQKDTFLIIDAGKGTTDFSIIRYDTTADRAANNSIISLKRGGIVGAGGAIDYVFARVFARQVYNYTSDKPENSVDINEFTNRFMTMIAKLSPLDQDVMMQNVELLKKNYRDDDSDDRPKTALCDCFKTESARNIVSNLLQADFDGNYDNIKDNDDGWKKVASWNWDKSSNIECVEEDKNEVEWVCNAIAETIVNKMIFAQEDSLTKAIDYVIFNGRSFLFRPLQNAFCEKIEKHRGVHKVNFGGIIGLGLAVVKNKLNDTDARNLRVANINGFDMKAISVKYHEHDLGVNCNSDLCCMDGIELNGEDTFKQEKFWRGYKVIDLVTKKESKLYYIGYKNTSFVPTLVQINETRQENPTRTKLVQMTLFPVSFNIINLKDYNNE